MTDDESRGLIITLDEAAKSAFSRQVLSGFCTTSKRASDNYRTNRPLKLGQKLNDTINVINMLADAPVADTFDHIVLLYEKSNQKPPSPSQLFPKWRHLNNRLTAAYLHRALVKRANQESLKPHDVSIRLSPAFARKILAEGGAPYLMQRLRQQLGRTMGRKPDAWIMLEATIGDGTASVREIRQGHKSRVNRHAGLLHFHGAVSLKQSEKGLFEKSVRKLNASGNADFNRHESIVRPMPPGKGDGWVEYVTKYPALNSALLPGITRLSKTRSITSLAETLYNADRESYRQKFRQL